MKVFSRPKLSLPRSAGFSLVEVVLAVGIMALGVVTILGLLPHGMEVSRKTANELAESRIVDSIVGDLQGVKWGAGGLPETEVIGQNRYFDDQGLEIEPNDPDLEGLLSYVVNVELPPMDVRVPTNQVGAPANVNLRRVVIRIISAPLKEFNFASPPPGVPVKTYSQLIAKMR